MASSSKDRAIVFAAACHRLLSGSSSSPPTIDCSLDTLRRRLLSTTLLIVFTTACHRLRYGSFVFAAATYRLLCQSPPAIWVRHGTGTERKWKLKPNLAHYVRCAHGGLRNGMCNFFWQVYCIMGNFGEFGESASEHIGKFLFGDNRYRSHTYSMVLNTQHASIQLNLEKVEYTCFKMWEVKQWNERRARSACVDANDDANRRLYSFVT